MSEKEAPETIEEQTHEEVSKGTEEVKTAEEVQASESEVHEEAAPEDIQASAEDVQEESIPQVPAEKKGLMERRPSFAQSSVPNAHKGYSGTPPIIMLLIISIFLLLSIIFGTAAIGN